MITGMIDTSAPAQKTTVKSTLAAAARGRREGPLREPHRHREMLRRVQHHQRQEVVVPARDEREHQDSGEGRHDQPGGTRNKKM